MSHDTPARQLGNIIIETAQKENISIVAASKMVCDSINKNLGEDWLYCKKCGINVMTGESFKEDE